MPKDLSDTKHHAYESATSSAQPRKRRRAGLRTLGVSVPFPVEVGTSAGLAGGVSCCAEDRATQLESLAH